MGEVPYDGDPAGRAAIEGPEIEGDIAWEGGIDGEDVPELAGEPLPEDELDG